jgi:hypothetical protein
MAMMKQLLTLGFVVLTLAALGCQKEDPPPPVNTTGKGVSTGGIQPDKGAGSQPVSN